jgi:branched-chain amino acid transport system substrate-binding protein
VLPKTQPAYPSVTHAGAYSRLLHFLKAAEAMGGPEKAKASGKATVDMMKQLPTDDDVLGKGLVRLDGRKIHTTYLFEAKKPADSRRPWDYQLVIETIFSGAIVSPVDRGWLPVHQTLAVAYAPRRLAYRC